MYSRAGLLRVYFFFVCVCGFFFVFCFFLGGGACFLATTSCKTGSRGQTATFHYDWCIRTYMPSYQKELSTLPPTPIHTHTHAPCSRSVINVLLIFFSYSLSPPPPKRVSPFYLEGPHGWSKWSQKPAATCRSSLRIWNFPHCSTLSILTMPARGFPSPTLHLTWRHTHPYYCTKNKTLGEGEGGLLFASGTGNSTLFFLSHLHVVWMLRFTAKVKTNRACPLLFILFLWLFLSLRPFQLYFIP